jgi:ABC-type molybdenum transport system ATPase subunit/photorepair protein PhrA
MNQSSPIVVLEAVDVDIDGHTVLRDIHLRLGAGQHLGIVGANGSGKSTLLALIAGRRWPAPGRGRRLYDFGRGPERDAVTARERIAVLGHELQDLYYARRWNYRARDVVLSGFTRSDIPRRNPSRAAIAEADALLSAMGLATLADRRLLALSRGEQRRVLIARALAFKPALLLLDEPASGLDPRSRVDLRVLLRALAERGTTVLVSSHVLSELDELVDDAVFLSRGRTVTADTLVAAETARRTWRVRALSLASLTGWLTSVGAVWRPDDDAGEPAAGFTPPVPAPDAAGSVLIDIANEEGAAQLVRDAVAAGVPLVSLAPAGGALEQAYLALDEERR